MVNKACISHSLPFKLTHLLVLGVVNIGHWRAWDVRPVFAIFKKGLRVNLFSLDICSFGTFSVVWLQVKKDRSLPITS